MSEVADLETAVSVLQRVLGLDRDEALQAKFGTTECWDSLQHIEVVFQLEDAADVRFPEDVLTLLVDVESIARQIAHARGC